MKILCSDTFTQQYKALLEEYSQIDYEAIKRYKVYLDTVILNMPTKLAKFKNSSFFDDESIYDLEHQGHIIPFYKDEKNQTILLLGLFKKQK
ncbi:MAG: hypothetical protein ABGW85_03020 [Sulfurimonas sp.]|jgi:hypothetical protein